jgi:hypothetical protein
MSEFPVIDKSELEAWEKAQLALKNDKFNKKRSAAYNENKKETNL